MGTLDTRAVKDPDFDKKIGKLKVSLLLDKPFFGIQLMRLKCVEVTTQPVDRAATDGVHLFINSGWFFAQPKAHQKAVMVHEVLHCAFGHMSRRGARLMEGWNAACDYAINPIIEKSGMQLPEDCLRNKKYDGLSAERIYTLLPDSEKQNGPGQSGIGDVMDAPTGNGAHSAKELEQEWKAIVSQAAMAEKMSKKGDLPGWMEQFIDAVNTPKVDWRQQLRNFVSSKARNDYSFRRPNRRYRDFYIPKLEGVSIPKMHIGIDVSGSVSTEEMRQFLGETSGILQEFMAECLLVQCDTRVTSAVEYEYCDLPLKVTRSGFGGTSLKPLFDYFESECDDVRCIIIFSDMEIWNEWPDDPGVPVLWVSSNSNPQQASLNPPYGEMIIVDVND